MPNLSGGQKFPFPTLFDFYRECSEGKGPAPTEWISSMVVVTTPNKIRNCLDPKDLKKAVIRPMYQMPTLDELLLKLSKAKVFSTLDAKDSFSSRSTMGRKIW